MPAARTTPRTTPAGERLAVFLGGSVGAALRALATGVAETTPGGFPTATLVVNLTGALVLGLIVGRAETVDDLPPGVVALVGTGLLGAYTTFSALAVEMLDLLGTAPLVAAAYAMVSLVGGIGAAVVGRRLGGRQAS